MEDIINVVKENPIELIMIQMIGFAFIIGRVICWGRGFIKKEELGKLTFHKAMTYIGYGMIPMSIIATQMLNEIVVEQQYSRIEEHMQKGTIESEVESDKEEIHDAEYWRAYYEVKNREVLDEQENINKVKTEKYYEEIEKLINGNK